MLPRLCRHLRSHRSWPPPPHAEVKGPTPFGKTADGTAVESYTLKNKNGVTVKLMTLGARHRDQRPRQKRQVRQRRSRLRRRRRISRTKINTSAAPSAASPIASPRGNSSSTARNISSAINNEPNHLHGGVKKSLDKVVWKAVQTLVKQDGSHSMIVFEHTSRDGDEGYPGNVTFSVSYSLSDGNELHIRYIAKTDKATPINLTNHSYFNLAGAGADTVLDHELMVSADEYVPVDKTLIPTGKLAPVEGTVFDFTKMTRIGDRIEKLYDTGAKGYDHCFVLTKRQARCRRSPPSCASQNRAAC